MTSQDVLPIPLFRQPDDGNPDWVQTVQTHLARENPSMGKSPKVVEAFQAMNAHRKLIAAICNDATQSTDNRITEGFIQGPIKEYLQLLHFAQSHLPLNGEAVKGLNFGWPVSNSNKRAVKQSSKNSSFEYASMLTVAANCYVRIAQREISINGVEGAKNAYKLFQNAAGVSDHIGTKILKSLAPADKQQQGGGAGGELSEAGNEQMTRLYLTYAHHSALIKAELEMPTKYSILSKLAMEGSNAYGVLAATAKRYAADGQCPLKEMPLDLEDSATFHSHILKAKANFFLAQELVDKQSFGAAIGRCNNALDALNLANQLANSVSRDEKAFLQALRLKVDTFADKAVHENSTLYFDRVSKGMPDPDAVGKMMGKATPFEQIFPPTMGASGGGAKAADPFFGIIPMHVLGKVNEYRNRVKQNIDNIAKSVAAHKARTNQALQTYGVHAAIQVATSEHETRGMLPVSLRNRILAIRGITDPSEQLGYNEGVSGAAIDTLVEKFDHINNVVALCRDQMASIDAKLEKEAHEDAVKRESYGAKVWGEIRKPFEKTEDGKVIASALRDYKSALEREGEEPLARSKSILQANLRDTLMIDWPLADLNKLMPYTKTTAAKESSQAAMTEVKKLQKILKEIEANEAAEAAKLEDLRLLIESDEIAHLLSATPSDQHEEVMEQSRKVMNDRSTLITSHMNATDELVAEAGAAMTAYATVQSTDGINSEVQTVCNTVMEAINLYDVVSQDVHQIGKFVDTLSNQIDSTSAAVDSWMVSRQYEMDELVSQLDAQVAAKISEMERHNAAKTEADQSRARQEELKARLAALEGSATTSSAATATATTSVPPTTRPPPQTTAAAAGSAQQYGVYANQPQQTQPQPQGAYYGYQQPQQPQQPPPQQYQQPPPVTAPPATQQPPPQPQQQPYQPYQYPGPQQAQQQYQQQQYQQQQPGFHQPMPAYGQAAPQWAPPAQQQQQPPSNNFSYLPTGQQQQQQAPPATFSYLPQQYNGGR